MADIRELIIVDQMTARKFWAPALGQWVSRLKLALRRVVVATSVPPVRSLYAAIYRAHVRYAVRVLRKFPGIRAIYVTRGALSKEAVFGVSDIDLFVIGDWRDGQQEQVVEAVRCLSRRSPLFDHANTHQVHTVESLRSLFTNDYYFQFRFNQARERCHLVYGDHLLADLPPVPRQRARGGYFMETKLWWMTHATSAFGSGPTTWDKIFRNSVGYKAVAEVVNLQAAFAGEELEHSRSAAIQRGLRWSNNRAVLERLMECSRRRFQRYDGDVHDDTFRFLLTAIEEIHAGLAGKSPFVAIDGVRLAVDAPSAEVLKAAAAQTHADSLIAHVRQRWSGYRCAFLLPRNSLAGLDDLQLLLEVDPRDPPSAKQVRELCAIRPAAPLRQRVATYLLLEHGAYLLDRRSPLEFPHVLLTPAANPEVFGMLNRPAAPPWTQFAATMFEDELRFRRSAMAKAVAAGGPLEPLFLLRGIWRHLQLEAIVHSAKSDVVRIPLTIGAVRRGLQSLGIPDAPLFDELQQAYESELRGEASGAAQLIPKAVAFFSRFGFPTGVAQS